MILFLKKMVYSTIIIMIVSFFPFLSSDSKYLYEILSAFSISISNAVVGYYLVSISINKPDSEFYSFVFGGMLLRMIVVFGFSIYIIKGEFVSMIPYMLFLILFYTIHQWIEITSWIKDLPLKKIDLKT